MGKHADAYMDCPYYVRDDGAKLICEGITDDMMTVQQVFDTRQTMLEYRKRNCVKCWRECPVKKLNDLKWGYEA